MKNIIFPFMILLVVCADAEEAYQLLRADPTGYAQVTPGRAFEFPRHHFPHKGFRIEWWYLTANLKDKNGDDYGVHWTLFRQSMSPEVDPGGWQSNQVWMGHTAFSSPKGFSYEQRFARGGVQQADVSANDVGQFAAWLDNWRWQGEASGLFPGTLNLTVQDVGITLSMEASLPFVLQGQGGYSQKSEQGQASYYYSQPNIEIKAVAEIDGEDVQLEGEGWLDREWSSQPLAPDQPGWDWLSVHLDDGYKLMVYRLRQNGRPDWLSGSWVDPKGQATTLKGEDIIFEPIEFTSVETPNGVKTLPLHWQVRLAGVGRSFEVSPLKPEHWLDTAFPYWEGPVQVTGGVSGRGYLELTGY